MRAYLRAVGDEIEANAEQFADMRIEAVRFGGGIASNAGEGIAEVMRCVRQCFEVAPPSPVTMRSSIANISGANMTWFKRAGICRYDFEMMSLNQMDFFRLNKADSLNDFETVCDYILRSYDNDLLGLVLAYGLEANTPRATIQNFRDSVLRALRSHVAHLILVPYEGDTPASDEQQADQLAQARELLAEHGFCEYIPLHFAREGLEDLYFQRRHEGATELAFGLGARTIIDGIVSTNTSDLDTYLQSSADYTKITVSVEPGCR
jgi:oxygen-independent coproporphyrinogen-3 oxidase